MAEKRENLGARMSRAEKNIEEITQKHAELDDMVKVLMAAQIKTEERFQETDRRIATLVSAIGESISRMRQQPASRL
jgi:predicted  nucleic acid-binding Zn-ribbon protein